MANAGKGGKGGGRGGGIARLAQQQIHASEQPVLNQIQQERAANLARAQQQMGFAKAAAAIMQQAAPNVQQGYVNAANSDAGYARGLGNAVQAPITANTQANNAFLTNMGTPSGALQAPAPVGDLAYGTHGYIPATTLQREGAAWGAAAQLAPGNMLHQGQQEAASTLGNDPNLAKLQNTLAQIAATQPQVYQRLLQQFTSLRQSQQRIGLERQSLQLRALDQQQMNAYRQVSLQLSAERIGLARRKDSAAIALAIQAGKAPDGSLSKIYGYIVDQNGNPILNAKGKKIQVKTSTSKSSSGLPGLPPPKGGAGSGAPGGIGSSGGAGGFLPAGVKFTYGRQDQGRDIQTAPGTAIIAPGAGYVVRWGNNLGTGGSGFGPRYPIVHFTSGPYAGQDVYIGHTVAILKPGAKFKAGARLSRTVRSGTMNGGAPDGWAEIGFAPGGGPGSVGQPAPF